jgi:hypothetical protein
MVTYERKIIQRPLTREEALTLVGHVAVDGRMLTVDEILADPNLSAVKEARNILTGKMEKPRSGLFVTIKAS